MAKPGVPTTTQLSVSQGFTVGDPEKKPQAQTIALSPLVGGLQRATFPVLCGVDTQSGSVFSNGFVGESLYTILIPLPNLPAPFVVGPSDKAQFIVALSSFSVDPANVTAWSFLTVSLTPQALCGTTPVVTGPGGVLRQGTTYTGWQVSANILLHSPSPNPGGNYQISVGVSAWIYDSPLTRQ